MATTTSSTTSSTGISSSLTGSITIQGLGSGTDFSSTIDGLIKIESQSITQYQNQKTTYSDKLTATQELNTALLTLKSTLTGMDTMGEFLARTANTTDDSVLTATASSKSSEGVHTIKVNQLAQNQILVSNASFANSTTDITSGAAQTFVYTYAGTQHTVNVSAGSSLDNLAAAINADATNPGVKASVLKVNTGEYRLQLRGMDLGASNTLTVDGTTSLANFNGSTAGTNDFTVSQAAQNAQLRVDGYPSSSWIERSTNSISDVIDGTTLNLKQAAPGETVTLSIATDTDTIKSQIQAFVDAVNTVRTLIQADTKYDSSTKTAAVLNGDTRVNYVSETLKDLTATSGLGFNSSDTYSTLSQIGITTDATDGSDTFGQLVIDDTKLDAALASDPTAVAELFATSSDGISDSPNFVYASSLSGTTQAGTYAVNYTVSGGAVTGTIGGYAANYDSTTQQFTGQAGTPVAGMAIKITNLANGAYSGNLRLRLGKSGEMVSSLSSLTDGTTGPLVLAENSYTSIMDSLDKKIASEQARITNLQAYYKDMFSRLDATLSQYSSIQKSLESNISALTSSSSSS